MKSLIQHAGSIYTKVAEESTPLRTFVVTMEGVSVVVKAPTSASARLQLCKFLNASTCHKVGKDHGVTPIAPGYAKQLDKVLGMGPAAQTDPECAHEHTYVNDRMETVCTDCDEVLGR